MRRNRLLRLLAACVACVALLGIVAPEEASAAALTSATFATSGTGYAVTGAQNTRYDWGFTTPGSATLGRASMSIPVGTSSTSTKYLQLFGNNDYATTPDASGNSPTANLDLRVKASLNNWTQAGLQTLIGKWQVNAYQSYWLGENNGQLTLLWSTTGTNSVSTTSSAALPFANQATGWVRATLAANTGSNNDLVTFYTSNDGTTWSQLGAAGATGSVTSVWDGPQPVSIGANFNTAGASAPINSLNGNVYFASIASAINGTTTSPSSCNATSVGSCFYPQDDSSGVASWVSSSPGAETWSLVRANSVMPADIAADLTVVGRSGLPAGGYANLRYIDGLANYFFSGTVAASTPCSIGLSGFINTPTPGSYTSTITTYNAAIVALDTATTSGLTFAPASNTITVSATVDPTFTFTVANQATVCNGESNFVSSGGSATGVALGHVGSSSNASAGQALSVASNAGGGFNVYIRGTQTSQNLRSSTRNWTDVAGTYASPAALGSGEAFGYTYKDSTASTSVTNPASAMFAALTGTNQAVMGSTSSSNGNSCVSFDAQTAPTTPAGTYSATIVYIAIPTF